MSIRLPALLLTLALVACGSALPPARAQISIDRGVRYQTMTGWEATSRLWEQNKVANRYDGTWLNMRDEIVDALVDEVGLNRIRIEVRSGMENPTDHWARFAAGELTYREFRNFYYLKINDNDDPRVINPNGFHWSQLDFHIENMVLPMQERLRARGERLFINLCFVDFEPDAESGNMEHALASEEYAEFIVAAFEHMRDRYGITPDALEITLEPENTVHWRGEQIGRAIAAVAPRLAEHGFRPRIIAPSTTAASNAPRYIDEMMRIPGVANAISTFAYHNYDNPPDSVRQAILQRAERAGVTTEMLEHTDGDVRELHRDITVTNAAAWQQYGIALLDEPETGDGDGYLLIVDPERPEGERVRLAPRAGSLSQFYRNVRLGAVRIEARSNSMNMLASAFVNPDGSHVALILSARPGAVTISGLPAGAYEASFAPEREMPQPLPDLHIAEGEPLSVDVAGRGVLAIRQRVEASDAGETGE